jgi:hypothetical protein
MKRLSLLVVLFLFVACWSVGSASTAEAGIRPVKAAKKVIGKASRLHPVRGAVKFLAHRPVRSLFCRKCCR